VGRDATRYLTGRACPGPGPPQPLRSLIGSSYDCDKPLRCGVTIYDANDPICSTAPLLAQPAHRVANLVIPEMSDNTGDSADA